MPYFVSNRNIRRLSDYIDAISELRARDRNYYKTLHRWYRGHASMSWNLIPKIQRELENASTEDFFRRERDLVNNFQIRASILSASQPSLTDFAAWLTIMQHYGVPTRLLDWSRSPLVALYFALNQTILDEDGCVWMLLPEKLNASQRLEAPSIVDDKEYINAFVYSMAHNTITKMIYTAFRRWELSSNGEAITPDDKKFDHRFRTLSDKIAACYPIEADGRIYNQYAAFTVHNTSRLLIDACDDDFLMQIIIPADSKKQLLDDLAVCGITESIIFPDYEHLANELRRVF